MLTVGYEIIVTYPTWHLNLVMNLVAGNARLETLILPFLSLSHRDLLSLCKKVPTLPGVCLSPLFKQLSPDWAQNNICLCYFYLT